MFFHCLSTSLTVSARVGVPVRARMAQLARSTLLAALTSSLVLLHACLYTYQLTAVRQVTLRFDGRRARLDAE